MRLGLSVLPPLCFLLFGLVMVYGSLTMEPSFSGKNEHRWVPLGMSIFVCGLSAVLIARTLSGTADVNAPIDGQSLMFLILPCLLIMAAYAQGAIWFGYIIPTLLSGTLVFRLFKTDWIFSLIHSLIATTVLYFIFFRLLKLYNPPGSLLDLPIPF